ncbi:hypothetical protein MOJ79_14450 [Calidifontimicrobium sp. SYSU G02091]|uniref:Sfum_1244 family protein n=1 Tax=Calidifontimicrobium sp. SYSU G02091 TaxID=2926421 RepID=UPI001F52BF31|nr:Sfum_1244 family protein [Calidifontimicrobium sp. SYSU G02091]MCI1193041.1 hypothetical protein [Calidifontimicrobium sp. SYSU G02091]
MTAHDVAALTAAVQTNCHIADARHAAELTLCSYLLQMRELYRWEQRLPLGAPLARDAVGPWLARREREWAQLEGRDFVALPSPAAEADVDPFDVDALASPLAAHGLAYGAALAGRERPAFFLAELLEARALDDGLALQVCGRELARGLFAPPAALVGDTVVLRRESFARWMWEKFEAFGLRRADGAFKAVVDAYGLDRDFDAALPRLLDEQGETLVLHELGEWRAAQRLEPGWAAMRRALDDRRADLQVRAVRDLVADLETTLPTLLARDDAPSLHFFFATFDGLRAALCPALPRAYATWRGGDGGRGLRDTCAAAATHFTALADEVLALHARDGDAAVAIGERLSRPDAVFQR